MATEDSSTSGMAGRYASALFALATERGAAAQVAADLDQFASLLDESSDLRLLVRSPAISAENQTRALVAVLSRIGTSALTMNFLQLVARKRRLFAISAMVRAYHAKMDAANSVVRAVVTVAEPLRNDHRSVIEDAIRQAAKARSVQISVKVDPSLIGGISVLIGSRMIDGSLRTKLNSLRTRMKEVH